MATEAVLRYTSTALAMACTVGLSTVLGLTMPAWVAWGVPAVLFGVIAWKLWYRHLEHLAKLRDIADAAARKEPRREPAAPADLPESHY